jgi:hypothetical protein
MKKKPGISLPWGIMPFPDPNKAWHLAFLEAFASGTAQFQRPDIDMRFHQ